MKRVNTEVQLTYPAGSENRWVGDDVYGLYLHNTRQKKRIDREELNLLAKTVQQGFAAQEALSDETISRSEAEVDMLVSAVDYGVKARNKIVETNTGLVHKWANRQQGRGATLEDLIQAGNMGLIRAAEKFDPDLGFTFGTYATKWIRALVEGYVHAHGRTIALSRDESQKLQKLNRIRLEHSTLTGKDLSAEELAEESGYKLDKVKSLLIANEISVTSLDIDLGESATRELLEYIPPDRDVIPDEDKILDSIMAQSAKIAVDGLLSKSKLSEQELEVVSMRYGIGYDDAMTVSEIAEKIGRSRNIVARMYKKAMQQLALEAEEANLSAVID